MVVDGEPEALRGVGRRRRAQGVQVLGGLVLTPQVQAEALVPRGHGPADGGDALVGGGGGVGWCPFAGGVTPSAAAGAGDDDDRDDGHRGDEDQQIHEQVLPLHHGHLVYTNECRFQFFFLLKTMIFFFFGGGGGKFFGGKTFKNFYHCIPILITQATQWTKN